MSARDAVEQLVDEFLAELDMLALAAAVGVLVGPREPLAASEEAL